MYEIIANPEDYQIDHLINGTGNAGIELTRDERGKWANEIVNFSEKLTEFSKNQGSWPNCCNPMKKYPPPRHH